MNNEEKESLKKMLRNRCGEISILDDDDSTFNFECKGCGKCCTNREEMNIVMLSPYDIYKLAKGLNTTTMDIAENYANYYLGPDSGIVIQRLATTGMNDRCKFLVKAEDGSCKCSIHEFKPTICNIFPLGRVIGEDDEVTYIFQHDTSCQNGVKKPRQNKIGDWVKDRENAEKSFVKNNRLIREISETLRVRAIADDTDFPTELKQIIFSVIRFLMYLNYDTDKDFFDQQKENATDLINFLRYIGSTFEQEEKEKFLGKQFKVELTNEGARELLKKIKAAMSEREVLL